MSGGNLATQHGCQLRGGEFACAAIGCRPIRDGGGFFSQRNVDSRA